MPSIFLLMGVSGSGKTTVGRLLADRLAVRFVDGDDLHPEANVRKMASGTPLTDDDRAPWIDAVRARIARAISTGDGLVVACSALKESYRRLLVKEGEPVRLVHLSGPRDLIAARLRDRSGHFMPPGLLESQFRDLDAPADALVLDIRLDPADLVDRILTGGSD